MEAEKIEGMSVEEDKFGGVILTVENPMDSHSFASKLKHSMSKWTQQVN